ncbi:hypothetical protein [Streptomyces sp. NPDC049915]|uniref:hypothetical protein n=1 Tax=Streptomyces sp. NPDC049915 TaxID=3155510 RepID=UPI00344995F7
MKASGSARPKRGKAARGGLRYEHRPGRPAGDANTGKRDRGWLLGCVTIPVAFLALLAPVLYLDTVWGRDIWAGLAPAWPGGAYAFAGCVGALVPPVFLAFVAPLTRMDWKKSRLTALARVLAALPGLAGGWLLAGIIAATLRPRHRRDWNGSCHARGGPCWVHDAYPFLWAVGTAATLAVVALLIGLFARRVRRTDDTAQAAGPADSPAGTAS